jgi:hypothetical protein
MRNRFSQFEPGSISGSMLLFVASAALCCVSAPAQVMQPAGTFQGNAPMQPHPVRMNRNQPPAAVPAPTSAPASSPAPSLPAGTPSAPAAAPSLFDQPAQAAKVELSSGKLAITANNSSLQEILKQVTTSTGMAVDGLNRDQRIFGTYGPGDPHEVLGALLDGTGYNVLMFGQTAAGAPRQLTLSQRTANVPGAVRPNAPQNQDDDAAVDDDQAQQQPAYQPPPAQPDPNAPPVNNNSQQGGVRSPQQMLQQLQQMRQQQQQQQPPAPQ